MNALDIILIFLISIVVVIEAFRGCGMSSLDALALYVALFVTSSVYQGAAGSINFATAHNTNLAISFAVCFLLFGALGMFISKFTHDTVPLHFGMLDRVLGVLTGIGVALILCHVIVRVIDISATSPQGDTIVASSAIGSEALNFNGYHAMIQDLASFTDGRRGITTD